METEYRDPDERSRMGRTRAWGSVYLKGVFMGVADAIPGVSGGTIALITGIYDRLVAAVAGLSEHAPDLLDDLAHAHNPSTLAAVGETLRRMDVPFLLVLGLGVLTGVATLASVVDYALAAHPALTFAFFFGLILASPVVLRHEVSLTAPRSVAAGVAGFALAFVTSGLPYRNADYALPALFLIGAVAICAMVLPGISGSLLLLIIGVYDFMLGAVSDLTHAVVAVARGGSVDAIVEPLTVVGVFAAGAAVGILTFARVISWALDAYRTATMTFLVGIMIGALRTPVRRIDAAVAAFTPSVAAALAVAALAGAVVVLALARFTADVDG